MLREVLTVSALILAVLLVRAAFKNRVPKRMIYLHVMQSGGKCQAEGRDVVGFALRHDFFAIDVQPRRCSAWNCPRRQRRSFCSPRRLWCSRRFLRSSRFPRRRRPRNRRQSR